MERLTREEMLEARINTLERRLVQLEGWTGTDEDCNPDGEDASPAERIAALESIVLQLLRHIEAIEPKFSVKRLRQEILAIERHIQGKVAEGSELSDEQIRYFSERALRVIEDRLPVSRHEEEVVQRDGGRRFRPTLVPKETGDDEPQP